MTNYFGAFIFLMLFLASLAEAAPSALTYQGRIVKSDGTPLEYNSVSFSFEITSPDGLCILYREQVDGLNMVNSNGVFDVPIGEGVKSFPAGPSFGLLDAFANTGSLSCDGSSSFSPAFDDGRKLRVKFHDGSGWKTVSPDSLIRSVPYAGYARSAAKLGSNVASDFLLKTGIPTCAAGTYLSWNGTVLSCSTPAGGGGLGTVTDVTSANAYLTIATSTTTPQLTVNVGTVTNTLAAGDDSRFTDARTPTGTAGGDLSGTYPNPKVEKIQGVAVSNAAPGSGEFLKYNGTQWLSSVIATTDVSGLAATLGGYMSDAEFSSAVASAGCTASQTMYWNSGTGNFLCQTINTGVAGDVSGSLGAVSVDKIKGVALDFSVAPTSGQVLKYNGTSWAPAADSNSNGTISSLTGEVTASGSGAVAATVVSVGGSVAADIHNAELAANAATNLNTASTIIKRDPSGNFIAGSATLNSTVLKDSGTKSVTLQAPGTVTTSYVLKFPDTQGGANEYLMNDGAGNLSWSSVVAGGSGTVTDVTSANNYLTVTTGTTTPLLTLNIGTGANTVAAGNDSRFTDSRAPNGTASGDLSGTYPSPEVAKIQGNAVATGTIPGADVGKVYRWNGTSLTAAFLNFGDMRTALGAQQLVAACAANEKIQWSVITDAFTCQAIGSLNASAITAGTLDAARLPASATYWQDGGSNAIHYSAGNVGIGVASPNTALDLNGALSMKGIAAPAVSPAGEGRIYFDSTAKKFKTSVDTGAYADLGAPSFPLTGSFGTAAAPTYSFATDADTGMYRANADQLAFATGGTQRLRIQDSSFYLGSMGSSTSASPPSFRFDSLYSGAGSVTSSGRFIIDASHSLNNTGAVTVPALGVTHTFSGANLTSVVSTSGGSSAIFRISNTAGYPGTGYGSLGSITTQTGAGAITGPQIGSWGLIDLGAGAAMPTLTLASAVKGEVRLAGTATGGSTITTANGLEAVISTATNDVVTTWNGIKVRAPTGTGTVTTKYALVTESGSGNVGIGTLAPTSALEVNGTVTATQVSTASLLVAGPALVTGSLSSWPISTMQNYAADGYSGILLKDKDSVNQGAIGYANAGAGLHTGTVFMTSLGTAPLTFGVAGGIEAMRISNTGNLGLGNNSPSYKLDVTGDIAASGCLRSSAGVASGTCTSDARLKTDVSSFDLGLDALLGITPHFFKYNGLGGQPASQKLELGVIAQEVEKTAPELIVTKNVKLHPDDSQTTEIKQVNYTAFTYVLINAVKELYNKVLGISSHQSEQDRQIASLEEENQKLKQQLEKQQKELELIKSKLGM